MIYSSSVMYLLYKYSKKKAYIYSKKNPLGINLRDLNNYLQFEKLHIHTATNMDNLSGNIRRQIGT